MNPLARALRADKLTLAALEATLTLYQDPATVVVHVPVLAMLTAAPAELHGQAERLAALCPPELHAELRDGESAVGGGAFPAARLRTTLVALDPGARGAESFALRLRLGDPAVVARVADGRVLLDPRTLPSDAALVIGRAVAAAVAD
jgi:L-seryl-tRNA(Ser) seleniumtransferase